jgi:hypothetical protein
MMDPCGDADAATHPAQNQAEAANDQGPPDNDAALARFAELQAQLPGLLEQLLACAPHSRDRRPAAPHVAGVYAFTENDIHRYIGRTRNVNRRFGEHVRKSSRENQAPFAFNIAKLDAGAAGLDLVGTRKEVAGLEAFAPYFAAAKERVREMEFRFVQIDDSVISTVFDVYASIALHTEGEFNLFWSSPASVDRCGLGGLLFF